MSSTPRKTAVAVALCALGFAVGLAWLFWLRFQAGDLYPPYSSLRGDPLGTQVFFESVQSVGQGGALRNFRPLDQVEMRAGTTLLVCGVLDGSDFFQERGWSRMLERISSQGGRLVITFRPAQGGGSEATPAEEGAEPEEMDDNGSADDKDATVVEVPGEPDLWERLGIALEKMSAEEYDDFAILDSHGPEALPEMIPWRTTAAFDLRAPEWEVIYWWQEAPALVQRPWGKGTVVLASDSYLFSNEALRGDRVTALLAWWVQWPNRLLVDEFHHGLVKQPGIANLVAKYRLQGVAASLLIVVVLLLWRQAAPFAPTPSEAQSAAEESAVGTGAEEGWVGLMRQHIRSDDLLGVCHEAWRASAAVNRVPDARVAQLAQLMRVVGAEAHRRNPVTLYRQICQLLKEGKPS